MPTLQRADISLDYQLFGQAGGVPLLCLHGGGCSGSDFAALAELLGHDRQLACLDQRGHGSSDKPRCAYALAEFAGDAEALCEHLGFDRVIVVGHSLGGGVAVELLARGRVKVAGFVSIDSPVVPTTGIVQGLQSIHAAYQGDEGHATYRQFMAAITGFDHDPAAHQAKLESLCTVPDHVMGPLAGEMSRFNGGATVAAHPEVPLLHIDGGLQVCDLAALAELRPDAWIGKVVGTGHYPHVESPPQIAAMISHFLTRHQL